MKTIREWIEIKITLALLLIGIMPKNIRMLRRLFKTAVWSKHRMNPAKILCLHVTDRKWQQVFFRWVELCGDEEGVKGAFVTVIKHSHATDQLVMVAASRWISFLDDYTSDHHEYSLRRMHEEWLDQSHTAHSIAFAAHTKLVRDGNEFFRRRLDEAQCSEKAWEVQQQIPFYLHDLKDEALSKAMNLQAEEEFIYGNVIKK
jgi:hypothetical protein